ncbi:hypothetical protein [Hymenobacter guriensis]|uniref:Uncharacterized protein n=2 Tax=Hymenobacter TaxID=89966 RepID=A0ABS0L495_9BACT|nr:hypothetical protein [Hymenobacter guriensis]MBG8554966.1 hypothetical protein [Hymenobacter guriensis]
MHVLEPLPLLLITLGAAAVAFLLTATRQPRPLPRLTQGVLLLSTLTLVGSAIYAGLLVGAALSWCLLLLLLLLDEFLLLRGQVSTTEADDRILRLIRAKRR